MLHVCVCVHGGGGGDHSTPSLDRTALLLGKLKEAARLLLLKEKPAGKDAKTDDNYISGVLRDNS